MCYTVMQIAGNVTIETEHHMEIPREISNHSLKDKPLKETNGAHINSIHTLLPDSQAHGCSYLLKWIAHLVRSIPGTNP